MKLQMVPLWFLLFSLAAAETDNWSTHYVNEVGFENPIFCTENKKCLLLDHCPDLLSLMSQKALPVHRFRQLVCGYVGTSPKVCCDLPRELATPVTHGQSTSSSWLNRQCGKSLIRSNLETLGTYPFVARIGFMHIETRETKYPCSGAIISERTILTTATCALATSSNYKLNSVLVGEFDTKSNPDCNALFCGRSPESYNISYIIKHPNFHSETFQNNIALIRLQTSIAFTVTAQPVCILMDEGYTTAGATATLIGWGGVSHQKEKPSEQQWLEMKILPRQECSAFANRGLSVELCALGRREPCSGFSGSPLLRKFGDTFVAVGVLSYGSDCELHSNSPSSFVDVHNYAKWILENS